MVQQFAAKVLNFAKVWIVERIFAGTVYPNKPLCHTVFIVQHSWTARALRFVLDSLRVLAVDEKLIVVKVVWKIVCFYAFSYSAHTVFVCIEHEPYQLILCPRLVWHVEYTSIRASCPCCYKTVAGFLVVSFDSTFVYHVYIYISKWVYSEKNLAAQFFIGKYLQIQGGDFATIRRYATAYACVKYFFTSDRPREKIFFISLPTEIDFKKNGRPLPTKVNNNRRKWYQSSPADCQRKR